MDKKMSKYPQHLLSCAIASDGDRSAVPHYAHEAGAGRLSQEKGWTAINSSPISEGGIPPKREDFNGLAFMLSQFTLWYQQGGVMQYDASLDYEPNNEVFSGGVKYRCIKANGASTKPVAPGSDKKVWKNLDAPSVIAGQVTPFANCRVGGSDGRRLIPWGETAADERYVLCDGGSDGMGGNVPNLIGRFVLGCEVANAGETGGSLKATTTSAVVSGTVGETVLTVDQMPSHTHSGSSDSAGEHSHSRGSMNITGSFKATHRDYPSFSGAFSGGQRWSTGYKSGGGDQWGSIVDFDAASSWRGYTSYDGSHSHRFSMNATGGGKGHTHTLSGASHSHEVTLENPPFYRLAYFVKLPE